MLKCQARFKQPKVLVCNKMSALFLAETVLNTTVHLGVNMQQYRRHQFQFALKMAGHTGFTA